MTDRIPLDHLTSDQYDQLCNERDQMARDLAALREVARSYCPHCGRGDASPTTQQWEQQKQRADQAEELLRIAHDTSNKSEAERARAFERAEQAEAAIQRVRALLDQDQDGLCCSHVTGQIRAALDGPTPITGADGHIICTCTYGTPCGCGTSPHYQQPAPAKPSGFRPYQPADIPRTGNPDHTLVVEPYRNDWREHVWAFRCWGTPTCDGWLSLDHSSQQSAERARDRHVAGQHSKPAAPAATQTTDGSGSVSAPETEPNNREQP